MEPVKFSEQAFQEYCDDDMGFCTVCKEFTRDMVEPDARSYECEECGNLSVMGAEEALIEGVIDIDD
jgi:hypothetical protein